MDSTTHDIQDETSSSQSSSSIALTHEQKRMEATITTVPAPPCTTESEPEPQQPKENPNPNPSPKKSTSFKLTVLFLCLVAMLGAMDAVIVAACLQAITADLRSTSVESFWAGTSFLLSQTVAIPIYGTTSDIFGRKSLILAAVSIFTLGSIICATALSVAWLIGGRVVQGIGAGGMIPLVQVILSDISTMSERGLYMAFAALAWSLGVGIGIPIGGAIGAYASWRWVFWINLPICVPSIVGLYVCLHLQQDRSSLMKKLAMVDWLGLFVFTAASTLFLVGLTSGGVSHPWNSFQVLTPLILGFLLYPVFLYIEWKVAVRPMMPLRIFSDRSAMTGFTTSFLQGLIVWCYTFYFILFFLGAMQHSAFHSALESMTMLAYAAPASIVASVVVKKTQRFKYLITIGWALLVAGLGSNLTMRPDGSKAVLYAPRCIASIGAGILFPTPLFAVQAHQRGEDIGIATSVQVFARSLGAAFGVGLGGVIFQNEWTKVVAEHVREGKIPEEFEIPASLSEVAFEIVKGFPQPVQEAYRWVFSDSMSTIWWVMMGLAVIGLLISFTARNEVVRGGLSGNQNFEDKKDPRISSDGKGEV